MTNGSVTSPLLYADGDETTPGTGRKVRLHVVVPIVTRGFRDVAEFQRYVGPGAQCTMSQIDAGPASIECEFDDAMATPDTVRKVIEAERAGADAVIVDCMADPGVSAAREAVSIPVLGPGETSMHVASMLAHKFGFLTVLERLIPVVERRAQVYGLAGKLAGVRSVEIPVLELEDDRERTVQTVTKHAIACIEQDGAHALVFGCTGLMWCAAAVERALADAGYPGVPVVNPIPTTLNVAEAVVRLGLRHSQLTYPCPPEKPIQGMPVSSGMLGRP